MDEDKLYITYLNAFAVARSGGELEWWTANNESLMVARAVGASDGQDDSIMPCPKWLLLEEVDRLLHSEKKEEQSCKVVPMGDAEELPR